MNEKALEKLTGLSRRQIIMLQKTVIKRKGKVVIGLSYDYSCEEVEEFQLAKFFKDCGYTYSEIGILMEKYKINKDLVIDEAILKMKNRIKELNDNLLYAYELKKKK